MYWINFFIYLLLIFNVSIYGQTLDVKNVKVQSTLYSNIQNGYCSGLASIVIGYNQIITPNSFQISNIPPTNIKSLVVKKIEDSGSQSQLFLFMYVFTPDVDNATISAENTTLGLSDSFQFELEPCYSLNASSLSFDSFKERESVLSYMGSSQYLIKIITPSKTPYNKFFSSCQGETGYSCKIAPYSYLLPDVYKVEVSIEPFTTPEPTLQTKINIGYTDFTLNTSNPFYYSLGERTTVVKSYDQYPPNNQHVLIPMTRNNEFPMSVHEMSVESMNSIIYGYQLSTSEKFYPVKSNSASNSMSFESVIFPRGSLTTYLVNNITSNFSTYASTFSYVLNTVVNFPSDTTEVDLETQTNFITITETANTTTNFYLIIDDLLSEDFYFNWYPTYFSGSNSTNDTYIYSLALPLPSSFTGTIPYISGVGYFRFSSAVGVQGTPIRAGSEPMIKVNFIENVKISDYKFLARISIDSKYKVFMIIYAGVKIKSSDLVYGTTLSGIYEKEISYFEKNSLYYEITIIDVTGFSFNLYEGLAYNSNYDTVPTILFDSNNFTTIENITSIWFNKSVVDVTKGSVSNSLIMKLNKYNPNYNPYFMFFNDSYKYPAYYDKEQDCYIFNFTTPRYIFGNQYTDYQIIDLSFDNETIAIKGEDLFIYFKDNATLTVLNENGDIQQPIIRAVYKKSTQAPTLEWIITIEDYTNGFLEGTVEAFSYFDTPYTIYFNNTNRVSGNQFFGNYSIKYTMDMACGKPVRLANFRLFDKSKIPQRFSPLTTVMGTSYFDQLEIIPICGISSNVSPTLVSFNCSDIASVGGLIRIVNFEFSTTSSVGISPRHTPFLLLSSENADLFKVESKFLRQANGIYNYSASAQLPYGFGFENIFISIYGIVGKDLSFSGYTFKDLRDQGFKYYMKREFNISIPVLESYSTLKRTGGSLALYGRGFGVDSSVIQISINYQDSNGYQNVQLGFASGSVIQLKDNIQPFSSKYITAIVKVNGIQSNELIIYPVFTFTNNTPSDTPGQCPGTPTECNGRGTCVLGVCQCQSPWYGPTCTSQIIIIPQPDPQPDPTISLNLTDNTINTIIQISEIRELDQFYNVLNSFKIENWTLTDLSKKSEVPTYLYSTVLPKRTTKVDVKIEFFKNQTQRQFGNHIIQIGPSAIKYSIEISPFDFQSRLSLLQVVMYAIIQSKDSDSCSTKSIGQSDDNNVQWLKINIDKTALYGRFLSYGIIDDIQTNISNRIVEDENSTDSSQFRSIKVGLTVPYYETSVVLDPDFSSLVDPDVDPTGELCPSGKKKLSNGVIAAIVVCSIVFVSIVIVATILIIKKRRYSYEDSSMSNKLKKVDK